MRGTKRLKFLRSVLVAALGILVLVTIVHDGEAPDLADLIDNRLHHEKLEAWFLAALVVVAMWPSRTCTHRRVHMLNLTPERIPGRWVFVCDNKACRRIFSASDAADRVPRREPFSTEASIRSWKGGRAASVKDTIRSWSPVAQYVVLLTCAADRTTLSAILEQAVERLSDVEYAVLDYFATNRERELEREGER